MKTRLGFMLAIAASSTFTVAGCSDDAVNYSQPVTINLKAKSDDTQNGVVTTDKGINTESGNPYGAFVTAAERELGRTPGSIEVDGIELFLGAGSTGVTTLGEIFAGDVDILFEMNDTDNSFPVASRTFEASDPAGPVAFESTFSSASLGDADYDKLVGGSFKVVLRGPATADFSTKGADADLQATFTFAAYE